MKIQYASDLHLELKENEDFIRRFPLKVTGDVLVLAGDTCYFGKHLEHFRDTFFKWCSDNYKETYLLPGNHEYYGGSPLDTTLDNWQMDIFPNVHYLNNKSVVIRDAELFFTTLWTHIELAEVFDVQQVMTDFKKIKFGTNCYRAAEQNLVHDTCRNWLERSLKESKAATKIVVTHHCPIEDPVIRKYVGGMGYPAYCENMSGLILETKPNYWIHGHTHTRCTNRMIVGDTTILTNPIGYVDDGENRNFDNGAIIGQNHNR